MSSRSGSSPTRPCRCCRTSAPGGEKKMYGKSTMGTLRRTFIFDENGILERIIEKVDTKNAAAQILE